MTSKVWGRTLALLVASGLVASASNARAEGSATDSPALTSSHAASLVLDGRMFAMSGAHVGAGPELALHYDWARIGAFADFGVGSASAVTASTLGGMAGIGAPLGHHLTLDIDGIAGVRQWSWTPTERDSFPFGPLVQTACIPPSQSARSAVLGGEAGISATIGRFFVGGSLSYDRDLQSTSMSYAATTCTTTLLSSAGRYDGGTYDPGRDHFGVVIRIGGVIPL